MRSCYADSLVSISEEVGNYKHTVVKSRNRHREVNSKLTSIAHRIKEIASGVSDLQKIGAINTNMLEELADQFRKGHIVFSPNIDESHKSYLLGFFNSIPGCVKSFENCTACDTNDETDD